MIWDSSECTNPDVLLSVSWRVCHRILRSFFVGWFVWNSIQVCWICTVMRFGNLCSGVHLVQVGEEKEPHNLDG